MLIFLGLIGLSVIKSENRFGYAASSAAIQPQQVFSFWNFVSCFGSGEPEDTTPPETTITSSPDDITDQTDATFEFTCNEGGCTYDCQLDGGGWNPCSSPKDYSGLSVDSHSFQVRAWDNAGNVDSTPAGHSWDIITWSQASADYKHSCAVASNGTLWCWGDNTYGQLGDGSTDEKDAPVMVGTDSDWSNVDTGYYYTCAIKNTGTLWCWGNNSYGKLGDGTSNQRHEPTQIGTDTNWDRVETGDDHTCGTKTTGTIWCWGRNSCGELGIGVLPTQYSPKQVGTDTNWDQIDVGLEHTCATKTTGTFWCWGSDGYGQLGDGTTGGNQYSPAQVGSGTNWSGVAVGGYHTCGAKSTGTIWCWGYNEYGQLGDGGSVDKNTPTQVGSGTNWSSLTAGYRNTSGFQNDNTLWFWGDNNNCQLADGAGGNKYSPTNVLTDTDWDQVDLGWNHSCAVKDSGTLWCWGYNWDGQVGDGTGTGNRCSPTQVLIPSP